MKLRGHTIEETIGICDNHLVEIVTLKLLSVKVNCCSCSEMKSYLFIIQFIKIGYHREVRKLKKKNDYHWKGKKDDQPVIMVSEILCTVAHSFFCQIRI